MATPSEFQWLVSAGINVTEFHEVAEQGPSEFTAAYIVAEKKPGGYSYGLAYRPGLSAEQRAALSEEFRVRILSLVNDGPDGPFAWSTGTAVPGYYVWIALHDLDPTL